jgi:hypothetical protein
MTLIQIDVADPEPLERCIELLENLCSGQASIRIAHRKEKLCGQYIAVSGDARQRLSQHPFGGAASIDVGRIDERDAAIERAMYARNGIVLLRTIGEGQPRSEGDLRDVKVAVTELAIFQGRYSASKTRTARQLTSSRNTRLPQEEARRYR